MKYVKIFFLSFFILLITVIATAYILFKRADMEIYPMDAAARKNATGSFVPLSDGITHYELSGPDTGKVVVLIHGFSVPYYIWDSTFTSLVQAGFRVLRYDEFGRGFSDRPGTIYEASLFRRQLLELLAALHIQSVHAIAGLSFGGPVTADFVAHYPGMVTKILLLDPLYPDAGPQHLPWSENFQKFQMAIAPEKVADGQLTDLKYPVHFPGWASQYKEQMKYKGFRNALVSTRFHYASSDSIRSSYRALNSLHKPILLIWGEEDKTLPFRYSDSLLKVLKADFMPVADAAHLPQMEKALQVNEKIITFLRDN